MSNLSIQNLHSYIVKIAKKELNNSSFLDTVTTGTITASLPGYYQVSLANSGDATTITAVAMNDTVTYSVNDYVYLLNAPSRGGDNFTNSYFIFGRVTDTQTHYANLTDWERFNANLSKIELTSSNIVTDLTGINETLGGTDYKNLIDDIKLNGSFAITGYFTANSSSDYGLKVDLKTVEDVILESFILDKNYFTGQVSKLAQSYQKRICRIQNENTINSLAKVVITGFNNTESSKPTVQNIAITAGSMYEAANNLDVRITTLSGYKNYFRNTNGVVKGEDQIGLKATLYYNDQPLAADMIRYYWCIKDDSVTSTDTEYYLPYAGDGWKCLNGYSTADVIGTEEVESVKIWNSSSTMIIDESTGEFTNDQDQILNDNIYNDIFNKNYTNKVVCFVKYKDTIIKSKEFDVINYALHNFQVSLNLDSGEDATKVQKIINENDTVSISCKISNIQDEKDIPVRDAMYTYRWRITADGEDITDAIGNKDNEKSLSNYLNYTKIIIKDTDTTPTDVGNFELDDVNRAITVELPESGIESDAEIKVSAVISIKVDGADDAITLTTNEIKVLSYTSAKESIHSIYSYKYYFSESMNVTFEKDCDTNGIWNGSWDIKDPTNLNASWKDITAKDEWKGAAAGYDNAGFKELSAIKPEGSSSFDKVYYLYYTKQESVYEYANDLKKEEALDSLSWEYPLCLARFKYERGEWVNSMSSVEIDQINTFNQFTKGGIENGIFYQEEHYEITKDTTPQNGIIYYTVSYNDKGVPTYAKYTGTSFKENTTYYVKSADQGEKLYINATYINTGTLRVGSPTNEKFYASIHNPDVRIAGWEVDNHSLTKGTVGISSNGGDNNKGIAFWAGSETAAAAPFSVTHDGYIKATAGTIGGWTLSKHPNSAEHNFLYNRQSSFGTGLSSTPTGDDPAFWAGFTGEGSTPWNDTQWFDKTNFYVTNNGHLVAESADITGKITATSGTIGGYSIGQYTLASGGSLDLSGTESENDVKGANHAVGMCMKSGYGPWAFWAGNEATFGTKKFRVGHNGLLCAEDAIITGHITATSLTLGEGVEIDYDNISNTPAPVDLTGYIKTDGTIGTTPAEGATGFVVSKNGLLKASNAIIYGTLYASEGKIGGLTLKNNVLSSNNFTIDANGLITAKNADIEGKITATSGDIGSLSLIDNNLTGTGFSLGTTSTGTALIFSNSSGNPTTTINNTGITTNSYQAGKLIIKETGLYYGGASGMEGTEIQMAEQVANQSKSWTLTITAEKRDRPEGTANKDIYVVGTLTGGGAPYELRYNVAVKMSSGSIVGSGSYNDYKTLIIPSGATSGEVYMSYFRNTFSITDWWFIDDNSKSKTITIGTNPHIGIKGTLAPLNDNECDLGYDSNGKRWRKVYTINGVQQSSDLKLKNTILALTDSYSTFFDNLKPVSYFFNHENNKKIHIGYIAQDVEYALIKSGLSSKNFSGLTIPNDINKEHYSLAYSEFIALNTHEIQKLKKRVTEQDQKILELEEKILNFEKLIQPNEN